jgi:hypothetical protein
MSGRKPVPFQRLAGLCRAIAVADAILPVRRQRVGVLRRLVVRLVDDDLGAFDGGHVLTLREKDDGVSPLGDEPAKQLPVLAGEVLMHQKDVHGVRLGAVTLPYPWP